MSALCDVAPKEAADAVVDDYEDFGLDAIYYHGPSETLYLVQAKLKSGATFSQEEANVFVQGIRKLIAQDFSGFNNDINKRQIAIEDAVENCSRIELVVAHVGAGLSHHGSLAFQQLLSDETHGEERFAPAVVDFDAARIVDRLQQGKPTPGWTRRLCLRHRDVAMRFARRTSDLSLWLSSLSFTRRTERRSTRRTFANTLD